ncbi:MAG: hypothetical protein WBN97_06960 [Parvibaculum sp.]
MSSIAVIHLVRHANPTRWLNAFLRSYKTHPSGTEHDLTFILKGFPEKAALRLKSRLAKSLPACQFLEISDEGYDINAYRHAAQILTQDILVFLNSHSVIQATDWLKSLTQPLAATDTGLTGATGNWEAEGTGMSYPNPHIRSNAFAIRRKEFLSLDFGPLISKSDCGRFEAGDIGMTRQLMSRHRLCLVVGKDGQAHAWQQWHESLTFRSGNQENLLIADNRTRDYQFASDARRQKCARLSWRDKAHVAPSSFTNFLKGKWIRLRTGRL